MQNLERVLQRGEKIELLVQKTEELQANSQEFRKVSTDLKKHFWWRNVKLWIIAIVCLLVRRDSKDGVSSSPRLLSDQNSLCLPPIIALTHPNRFSRGSFLH